MKKIFAAITVLALSSLTAFALDITVGARGNLNLGFGTYLVDDYKEAAQTLKDMASGGGSWDEGGNTGGGFGIYANFGLLELGGGSLGIQPEISMNFNNGYNYMIQIGANKLERSFYKTVIDIPVLVTFTYPIMDALSIGGGIGPYLSIPVMIDSQVKVTGSPTTKESDNYTMKTGLNIGLALDVNGAYKLGPGSIVLDLRYMFDFNPTRITRIDKNTETTIEDDEKLFKRGILAIGLGYQIKL
ncbi:MAG: hypothetical protein J6Y60_12795 [Treponema sp.]|nr:hypothetical protein [Treponema sp.]